jgi:hypothetical protein
MSTTYHPSLMIILRGLTRALRLTSDVLLVHVPKGGCSGSHWLSTLITPISIQQLEYLFMEGCQDIFGVSAGDGRVV